MITYRNQPAHKPDSLPITVLLDSRVVGKIIRAKGGYRFMPKGAKLGGEVFMLLPDLKRDLEGDVRSTGEPP